MNVVGLQDAADIGLVRRARAQALDRRLLVAEGHEEGIGELGRIKRLLGEFGNGLFDFNGVHGGSPGIDQVDLAALEIGRVAGGDRGPARVGNRRNLAIGLRDRSARSTARGGDGGIGRAASLSKGRMRPAKSSRRMRSTASTSAARRLPPPMIARP